MKNENESTPTSQEPARPKAGFGVFAWAAVAAGVVIAALAGNAQTQLDPNILYSLMLCYGALFYFLWNREGRKPSTGAWIGVGIGVLLFGLIGFFTGLFRS